MSTTARKQQAENLISGAFSRDVRHRRCTANKWLGGVGGEKNSALRPGTYMNQRSSSPLNGLDRWWHNWHLISMQKGQIYHFSPSAILKSWIWLGSNTVGSNNQSLPTGTWRQSLTENIQKVGWNKTPSWARQNQVDHEMIVNLLVWWQFLAALKWWPATVAKEALKAS